MRKTLVMAVKFETGIKMHILKAVLESRSAILTIK